MAETVTVLLLGTGLIGRSIGLALRRAGTGFQRVGFDPDPRAARQAHETGAIDKTTRDVAGAAAGADLVVLNLPTGAALEAAEALAQGLRPDTAVLVTFRLQAPLLEALRSRLPEANPVLGVVPILGPQRALAPGGAEVEPSADLFDGGRLAIILPRGTPEAAAQICLDLAAILGAGPFFLDAAELDSATATSEEIPPLLAAALLGSLSRNPGWRDQQGLVGSGFAAAAAAASRFPPDELAVELLANRQNILARLEALADETLELREMIETGDETRLTDRLAAAQDSHGRWRKTRQEANPDQGFEIEGVPRIGMFDRLFGRRGGSRPRR